MQQAIDTIQHPDAVAIVPQDKRRVAAAIEALAPNSRKQYGSAWKRFAAWCEANNRQALPATAESLADYLQIRHADGVSPATLRIDRAAASKVHAVAGLDSPGADSLVKDTMHSLAREGRGRGRGQAQGLQRQDAIAVAAVAASGEKSLSGLRDGAIIAIMSDGLLRISETSAIDVGHVQTEADGSGRLHLPQRKTDQLGEGTTLYLTRRTVRRLRAWTDAAGIESGPLFCQIRKGNRVQRGRPPLRRSDPRNHPEAHQAGRGRHRRRRRPGVRTQPQSRQRAIAGSRRNRYPGAPGRRRLEVRKDARSIRRRGRSRKRRRRTGL